MAVDPAMPAEIYLLGAVVAGEGEDEDLPGPDDELLWSASAPFNLRVNSRSVPEPSTLALAASSMLALGRRRRKE